MTLVLDLPPDVEAQLAARATAQGVEPAECALRILQDHLPEANGAGTPPVAPATSPAPEDPTLALFRQWREKDRTADPEELARRRQEWETFRDHMNATRAAAGARLLHPSAG